MIIVSTQCFPPHIGGIETLMYNICTNLYLRNHEVIVFADGHNAPDEMAFDRTQPFAINRCTGYKPVRRRKKARSILEYMRSNRAAGVIADSWKSIEHLFIDANIPILCLAHGTELPVRHSKLKNVRIKSSLGKASTIIANSEFTAQRTRQFIRELASVSVIHPGINLPELPDTNVLNRIKIQLDSYSPVLISVARLEKRKGIDKVLKVLPRLTEEYPDLLYVIIGNGAERKPLKTLAKELKLQDHVLFTGVLTDPHKSAYLNFSDLFILPLLEVGDDVEGFGIAFIEAAYFGVPAIAGRSGGAVEAVIDNQTGLVCRTEDEEDLFNTIHRLLADNNFRFKLGEQAKHRADTMLWTNVIKEYEELLRLDQNGEPNGRKQQPFR